MVTAQVFAVEESPARWVSGDPAATAVVRDGDNAIYRIEDRFDPNRCPKTEVVVQSRSPRPA